MTPSASPGSTPPRAFPSSTTTTGWVSRPVAAAARTRPTNARAAPGRSRHQPSGREPITFAASMRSTRTVLPAQPMCSPSSPSSRSIGGSSSGARPGLLPAFSLRSIQDSGSGFSPYRQVGHLNSAPRVPMEPSRGSVDLSSKRSDLLSLPYPHHVKREIWRKASRPRGLNTTSKRH